MTDYPEALIAKVAEAISDGIALGDSYTNHAERVLDAMDLTAQHQGPRFYKDSSSTRFVTRWVSDD